jgi:zinc-ribbon domain
MDIGSILLLLALLVLVGAFVASPLRNREHRQTPGEENIEISELLAERERILDALAELDFDNEMGKVPDDLYPMQREALVKRGAAVLKLLDERLPASVEAGKPAVARSAPASAPVDDPIEALILARRSAKPIDIAKNDTKTKFCPNCGVKLQPGDRFCAACGQKL